MKTTISLVLLAFCVMSLSSNADAQIVSADKAVAADACAVDMATVAVKPKQNAPASKAKVVELVQTPGEFTTKELKLKAGKYQFNVMNKNVGHACGFVLAPTAKDGKEQDALVKFGPIATGETKLTPEVELKKGKYEYFCPLNPTPRYTLVVE